MAIEVSSGRLVVVAICESVRLSSLAAARGLTHRHLATLIDVVRDVPAGAFPDRVQIAVGSRRRHRRARSRDHAEESARRWPAAHGKSRRVGASARGRRAGAPCHRHRPRRDLSTQRPRGGRRATHRAGTLSAPRAAGRCILSARAPARCGRSSERRRLGAVRDALCGAHRQGAVQRFHARNAPARDELATSRAARRSASIEPALQEILQRGLSPERRGRTVDLSELVAVLDDWERDPKRMPPPAPLPRPAPRDFGDFVSATASGVAHDDGIIIDDADLPDDQGRSADSPDDELATVIARPAIALPAQVSLPRAPAPSATAPAGQGLRPQPPAVPKRPSINPFERKGKALPWLLAAVVSGRRGRVPRAGIGSKNGLEACSGNDRGRAASAAAGREAVRQEADRS